MALFNNEAYHTAAISLNLVDNALLRYFVGPGYSISTMNRHRVHKFEIEFADVQQLSEHWAIIFCLSVTFPVIMTFYVMFLVEERVTGSKRDHLWHPRRHFLGVYHVVRLRPLSSADRQQLCTFSDSQCGTVHIR